MLILQNDHNVAKIFTDSIEPESLQMIEDILSSPGCTESVRIMPDVHLGKGIVIGFTMPLGDAVSPEWVGVDIGCGMASRNFGPVSELKLNEIDKQIRYNIPMGFSIHESVNFSDYIDLTEVYLEVEEFTLRYNDRFGTNFIPPKINNEWVTNKLKYVQCKIDTYLNGLGTLGGGNHFIELGRDLDNNLWATVHSGSRNFGAKIAEYWTKESRTTSFDRDGFKSEVDNLRKSISNKNELSKLISEIKTKYTKGSDDLLRGEELYQYLVDMVCAQRYALWSRYAMLNIIGSILKNYNEADINSIHNYIDPQDFIIRKGAIRSYTGEQSIIPFNMRDGILITEGKSNLDWNNSGPHGAGRLMSRTKAKEAFNLKDFKKEMTGVFSTSITKNTLDESPMAYKDSFSIENAIEPTAKIINRIKPILSIKDNSEGISWKERRKKK